MPTSLKLSGYTFAELFQTQGLQRLDQAFLAQLREKNPIWHEQLLAYRSGMSFPPIELSELLLACAPVLEEFLIDLFQIQEAAEIARLKTLEQNPTALFKKYFVLRLAKKSISKSAQLPAFSVLNSWLDTQLQHAAVQSKDPELAIGLLALQYMEDIERFAPEIEQLTAWCVQAMVTPEGKSFVRGWTSFRIPERIDYSNLVPTSTLKDDLIGRTALEEDHVRLRDGFALTDPRMSAREVQDEVHYCIYCHDHEGDFCSKGFPVKKSDPLQGLKKNPLGIVMTGCPLEEKISEMHALKRDAFTIGALAMVMVDNPMCPATGHRICNDCMKACVYQKYEPVNIPQVETRVLTDVLHLPWGVEIYDLLTRWNPLRQKQFLMKSYNGLKVLIAGMGPAGFTLAHHLLMEGFAVVGFDGLKIEPLPEFLIKEPIHRFSDLHESLDERLMAGFGGVAEYGITVRWDKNFLKLIYVTLMRRPYFQVFGSVRFGGTITVDDAWDMGFDHLALAVGAGLPKALNIPGSMAPGMRQANDFLMALQLGNAAKPSSLTNLQVRLPATVIGGGLTGVDTSTEVQAYYIVQVEKILHRYEKLSKIYTEEEIRQQLDIISKEILQEFLSHGQAVRKERENAQAQKRPPNFIKLIREWGGVTIVYRRTMQESPAYTLNHEELKKALEEGVYYAEKLEPFSVDLNQYGHVETLVCRRRIQKNIDEWETTIDEVRIPARAIFVATGTQPNTAYEFEHRGTFARLGLQYQHYEDKDGELTIAHGITHCKELGFGPFTSYRKEHFRVSLVGDTHPVFHGSVVKAIASGMRTYQKILTVLQKQLGKTGDPQEYQQFAKKMAYDFDASVKTVTRCNEQVLELTIHAPLAAKHFKPGQFYRLQNYETYSTKIADTMLQIEPLALVAAASNQAEGTLKFFVVESGASAKLCATLRPGDPVSLMGPTGVRGKIAHEHETVLIIGNQMSIPLLTSYGPALKKQGNHVIYFGIFNSPEEVYARELIEQSADVIQWLNGNDDPVQALLAYELSQPSILLSDVDRIYIVGDSKLLRQFQEAQKNVLKNIFIKTPSIYGSVYSTMQCMLKGVCAQCLQWQIDPETGKRTKAVFACSWPDQPLELIDISNIDERLSQNRLQEQLSRMWVDYLFKEFDIKRV